MRKNHFSINIYKHQYAFLYFVGLLHQLLLTASSSCNWLQWAAIINHKGLHLPALLFDVNVML